MVVVVVKTDVCCFSHNTDVYMVLCCLVMAQFPVLKCHYEVNLFSVYFFSKSKSDTTAAVVSVAWFLQSYSRF